jgi:hypothetical protein
MYSEKGIGKTQAEMYFPPMMFLVYEEMSWPLWKRFVTGIRQWRILELY